MAENEKVEQNTQPASSKRGVSGSHGPSGLEEEVMKYPSSGVPKNR